MTRESPFRKNLEAYRRMARKAGKIWREYGALEVVECVADDVKSGKHTSFPQMFWGGFEGLVELRGGSGR